MRRNINHVLSKLLSPVKFSFIKCYYYNIFIKAESTPRLYGDIRIMGERGSVSFGKSCIIKNLQINFLEKTTDSVFACGSSNIFDNNVIIAPRNGKILVGDNVFFGPDVLVQSFDNCLIEIGSGTMIGKGANIFASNHNIDDFENNFRSEKGKNVKIGKNVWVGSSVNILPGVDIGDNVVIGAGAVVIKSLESYSMAVGNPARIIKKYNPILKCWQKVN